MVIWDAYQAAGAETPSNHRSGWLMTTEAFLQVMCAQATPSPLSLVFSPSFPHPLLLFHLWLAISLCPDLIKCHQPMGNGELQPPELAKPQLSQIWLLFPSMSFSTCIREINLFYLPTMGPFGGFLWKQHNPMFMKSTKPGHLNWISSRWRRQQPLYPRFSLSFGPGSRLYFCLKQIKTNGIWWIWKREKKTPTKKPQT